MAKTKFLHFEGLGRSVALTDAAPVEAMVSCVLAGWPYRVSELRPDDGSFASIGPADNDRWTFVTDDLPSDLRTWDAVNTTCDLVAEMAWERLRSDPDMLCLHAAAVEFNGHLVVFPNARRAGKSTLAVALARLGQSLYTDDFLPVKQDTDSQNYFGLANGAAPRLRLPVPVAFSDAFHTCVAEDGGPANRQYKFLLNVPVARFGEKLPLGAIVVLDRNDDPVAPILAPMSRADALEHMITQNFARTAHAGTILKSLDAITRNTPIFRLKFHCGESAADYLIEHADLIDFEAVRNIGPSPCSRHAQPAANPEQAPVFLPTCQYVRSPRVTETEAANDYFLADSEGYAIFRLNAGSTAIWKLLKEPTDLAEVVDILSAAFPEVAPEQIALDSEQAMRSMAEAHLIRPADTSGTAR